MSTPIDLEHGLPPGGLHLFGHDMLEDPYPVYHRLRALDPVYWNELTQSWVLTRYAEVSTLLRDSRMSSERSGRLRERLAGQFPMLVESQTNSMLSSDAPRHTRMRGLVSKAFTPRAIDSMRPFIQKVVDEALDAAASSGKIELMEALAYPLPVTVIAEMLGVAREDRGKFKQWSDDVTILLGNTVANLTPENIHRAAAGFVELRSYFKQVVDQLRNAPRKDLMSALVEAEEAGDRLSEAELYANAILLLNAGHETTTNLIGNGTLGLLRHPDQLQKLRENPALVENAVEELLRYDSPVQFTSRVAKEDVEVAGKHIKHGQMVMMVLAAANRDPEHFPNPDTVDISRDEIHHVAFGMGPHYCLGAPLARLEGQIVFETLLRRFPSLRLAEETPVHRDNFNLRGLQALHLEV